MGDVDWLAFGVGVEVGLAIGLVVAAWMRDSAWREKASGQGSPIMCSGGRFYAVMTEHEYVQKVLRLDELEGR